MMLFAEIAQPARRPMSEERWQPEGLEILGKGSVAAPVRRWVSQFYAN
jgi:hypothetical protein